MPDSQHKLLAKHLPFMNHLKHLSSAVHQRLMQQKKFKRSRYLTVGEKNIARSVFADALAMDGIQLKTAWWVLKNYAVSPNGYIYFHPDNWIEDFSQSSLANQAWLIHELTHVWQVQQGMKVVRKAILNRRYDYVLKSGKSFFHYGIEQQARMVEDYFLHKQQGQDCSAFTACIPFLNTDYDKT